MDRQRLMNDLQAVQELTLEARAMARIYELHARDAEREALRQEGIAKDEAEQARIAEGDARDAEKEAKRQEAIAKVEAMQLRASVEQLQRELDNARKQIEKLEVE